MHATGMSLLTFAVAPAGMVSSTGCGVAILYAQSLVQAIEPYRQSPHITVVKAPAAQYVSALNEVQPLCTPFPKGYSGALSKLLDPYIGLEHQLAILSH